MKDWTGNKQSTFATIGASNHSDKETKTCSKCYKTKLVTEFYWHSALKRYASRCKECEKEIRKEYRRNNPEKIKELKKKYRHRRKEIRYETDRKNYLKQKYKLTEDEYKTMYDKQNGRCWICGDNVEYRKLCIDHSHTTGKIRGLLCFRCNSGLGSFCDNTDYLKKAIEYLEKNQ